MWLIVTDPRWGYLDHEDEPVRQRSTRRLANDGGKAHSREHRQAVLRKVMRARHVDRATPKRIVYP